MSEPIFFPPAAPAPTLLDLAGLTGSEIEAPDDLAIGIRGVASLDAAGPGDLTFFDDPECLDRLKSTRASACFITPAHRHHLPAGCIALVTEAPIRAFAQALEALFPRATRPGSTFATTGANPGAIIHAEARLEPGVVVDPGAVIGPRAEIGAGSIIGASSVIGPEVRIGRGCTIGAQVTIGHALVGDRVVLQPGSRIGQDGATYAASGEIRLKVPHVGRVIVQDDVEIGAGTTIDRGITGDTVVGEGTKIGNLVQISAGVAIGRHCLVAAQAGLASDARLGDAVAVGARACLGPAASVAAGERVADGTTIGRGPRSGEAATLNEARAPE